MRTLVVDDDPVICEVLAVQLRLGGWNVDVEQSGSSVLAGIEQAPPDVVLLDLHLGDENGLEILQRLRQVSDVPVIMLTGDAQETATIACLDAGADDYVTKPYHPHVLEARMRAVVRAREHGRQVTAPGVSRFADCELDKLRSELRCAGARVRVASSELSFLELLLRAYPEVVARETCADMLLGRAWCQGERGIDLVASRLRRKLGAIGSRVSIISVRRGGYRIAL
jgi:two-component system, OmpR family, response regulator